MMAAKDSGPHGATGKEVSIHIAAEPGKGPRWRHPATLEAMAMTAIAMTVKSSIVRPAAAIAAAVGLIAVLAVCALPATAAPVAPGALDQHFGRAAPGKGARPNILLILADDLGYSDIGAFGGEIHTPNLDRLAAEGRLLLNHHTATSCAPTRATLNAGTDQHLTGVGSQVIFDYQRGHPGYEGYLNERSLYLAELLRDGGYHTYIAGKWHLGDAPDQSPPARGYEHSYVLLPGVANHFGSRAAAPLPDNAGPYREDGELVTPPENFYSTDFYTDRLIQYLKADAGDGKPFFAFAAYTAPHWPLQAPDAFIDRYRGRYDAGYDAIRKARFLRQKLRGIVPLHTPFPEAADIPDDVSLFPGVAPPNPGGYPHWQELTPAQRALEARRMEVYAAMVENLDWNIGRLVDYLKRSGRYRDTLIVFHSDNGAEATDFGSFFGRNPFYDSSLENLGRYGSYTALRQGWAEVSSTPNRFYKSFATDGGHRVPTIVRLPGQTTPRLPLRALTTIEDWLPTFLDFAGIPDPGDSYRGRAVNPITGYSLAALLRDQVRDVRDDQTVWAGEQFNRRYLYKGDWKLVWQEAPFGTADWQLYHIAGDRTESRDLAALRPDNVEELKAEWERYVERFGVVLPPAGSGLGDTAPDLIGAPGASE